MKLIFATGLTLLFAYHLASYFIHAIYGIAPAEARHRLNHWLLSLVNQEPASQNAPVFFCEAEWRELASILERYFNALHLHQFVDCQDGTIGVIYDVGGIRTKYQDTFSSLKQCICYDTNKWILEKIGYEVPIHIQTLTDDCLHLKFAYSTKGIHTLESIHTAQKNLMNQQKKYIQPSGSYRFIENTTTSLILGIYYEDWYTQKRAISICIDLKTHCHILLTGQTGSGKSYQLLFILGQFLYKPRRYEIWFCDFKNSADFKLLENSDVHYACADAVVQLILEFYDLFLSAKDGKLYPARNQVLVIDEYAGLLSYLYSIDKKQAEQVKQAICNLLMLGRDVNGISFSLVLTAQRPDANLLFSHGARDNFHVQIALGNLSSEAKGMITDSPADLPKTIYKQGEGIVSIEGQGISELIVPKITNLSTACKASPALSSSLSP